MVGLNLQDGLLFGNNLHVAEFQNSLEVLVIEGPQAGGIEPLMKNSNSFAKEQRVGLLVTD